MHSGLFRVFNYMDDFHRSHFKFNRTAIIFKKASEYDQEIQQSHTADRPRYREEEAQKI